EPRDKSGQGYTNGYTNGHGPGNGTAAEPAALPVQAVSREVALQAGDSVVRTALTVEPRDGRLCVFMPPVPSADDYFTLLSAVEQSAADLNVPVHVEGYPPPYDSRINVIKVTPDP